MAPETTDTRAAMAALAAPHAAVGLMVIAAAAAHSIADLADAEATVALTVAGTAVVLAVVVGFVTGRRIACRRARHRVWAFLAVASAWISTVTVTGVSLDAVGLLAAMVYALSLHWWRARRISNPAPADVPLIDPGLPYPDRWKENLGGKGGALDGTRLQSPEDIKAGVRYLLRLVPGRQTYGTVLGLAEQIRGALDLLPHHDLIIERHPVLSASNLQLTIVTRSPISKSVRWPGPSAFNPKTGCVDLGPYSDGEDVASWRVYTENSLWGGYMTGSSGSGKSRMFESIALSVAASESHPTVVWFIDGDEGASSPLLMQHADHVGLDAELTQAAAMLAGALLLMQLRRAENVAYGLEGFTPTADRPGLLIFIDECHIIFANPILRAMAAEITRRGRKVGVNIIAASQVGTLDAFGGAGADHSDALRSSLRSGNAVILRSLTNNTKVVFGVDINPTQFPDLPGYAYYVAAKGTAARTAPFRGYYVDDEARAHWPTRIRWRHLNEGEANAYPGYSTRKETAEAARLEALAWIEATKSGMPAPRAGKIEFTIPKPKAAPAPAADFNIAQFPVWIPPATQPTPQRRPAADTTPAREGITPTVTERHTRLAQAIANGELARNGFCKPSEVAEHLGLTTRWSHTLLQDLVELGVLRKGDVQGRYYPTGKTLTHAA